MKTDLRSLKETVIDGGYCVGCGACSLVGDSQIKIRLDKYGMFKAEIPDNVNIDEVTGNYQNVCPFSDKSKNEDEIGKRWFGESTIYHPKIGYYLDTYAGYVNEGEFREKGSSGGMGSWLGYTLLKNGVVDGVIHIASKEYTDDDPRLFTYSISTSADGIIQNSKSRYYPIELSEVLSKIRELPGKYVLIGVPCFVKAVRLLQLQDSVLKEKIAYCVGLVCGHLKSKRFAEMFAWQCGVKPENLRSIDFRNKIDGYGANQYGVKVTGLIDNKLVERTSAPVNQLYGTNWGYGYFKYKSCDYCDDVVAETADITIGDAWLPQYVNDSKGTNVIVIRNKVLSDLIQKAMEDGRLILDTITTDQVVQSQRSGFEHRREGLAFRLSRQDEQGYWRPEKRVKPAMSRENTTLVRKQECRTRLADASHIAFNKAIVEDSFDVFVNEMRVPLKEYIKLYQLPLMTRIKRKINKVVKKILKAS